MGSIGIRETKRKSGKKTRSRVMTIYVDTGQRYSNGRKKYKQVKRTLGFTDEITAAQAKYIYNEQSNLVKHNKLYSNQIPKLRDFIPEYLDYIIHIANKRSWVSDQFALKQFLGYFGNISLEKIDHNHLINYQDFRIKAGRSNATVNRELSILRRFYNVAKIKGKWFKENPVSQIQFLYEEKNKDRVLSFEEEDLLMAASPGYLRDILICALNTGMRKNEIITLKWENVDLKNNFITIESTHTKTKRLRQVPINHTLRDSLLSLLNNQSDYVYLSNSKEPYKGQDSLKKVFNNAIKRSGIDKIRFHDLRHTAATRMVEAGADITDVASALGHYDIRTTMRYAHPKKSVIEAVEKLSRKNHTKNHNKLIQENNNTND